MGIKHKHHSDSSHPLICYDNNEKNKLVRIKLTGAQIYDKIDIDYKDKDEIQAANEKNTPPQKINDG